MLKLKKSTLAISVVVLIGLGFLFVGDDKTNTDILVYKSANCGCCVGWSAEASKTYDVDTEVADMFSIKQQFGIPRGMESCHTSIVGDYFVEGHVPIEAIEKLLSERPDIDGIAMPNMPAGSPGMPGTKTGPFIIYGIKDGESFEFMRL